MTAGSARVAEAVAGAAERLRAAGVDSPRLDAELLVAHALGVDRGALFAHPEWRLDDAQTRRAEELVARRERREPLAYIVGRRGFRRIELTIDRRALIPRPDTELVVDVALEQPPGARVHDVGTGSGAIALALLDERPDLQVSASDRSEAAAALARENAARLGLALRVDVHAGLPHRDFDLVVANLPYVRDDEWAGLDPEIVEHEPKEAFLAGPDGLSEIRALVAEAPSGTLLALEHAPAQAGAVRDLLHGAETRADLAGRGRVTLGRAP